MPFIDFSKIKFTTNWASATTIVTLLIGVITLYMTNNSLKAQIDGLKDSNNSLEKTVGTLGETVSALKGAQDVTSKAIEIFMQNPPGEMMYRIERMEHRIGMATADTTSKPFNNNRPH